MLNLIEPLGYKEIQEIVDNAIDNQDDFKPRLNKTKRFFFKEVKLTPAEKSRMSIKIINEEKRQETQKKKDKISKLFCNWDCHKDGIITRKAVMERTGLKKTMVYEYFTDNPDEVPVC